MRLLIKLKRQPDRERPEARITPSELKRRLERGEPTTLLDVRQAVQSATNQRFIPGSRRIPPAEVPDRYLELPRDQLIVPYCT